MAKGDNSVDSGSAATGAMNNSSMQPQMNNSDGGQMGGQNYTGNAISSLGMQYGNLNGMGVNTAPTAGIARMNPSMGQQSPLMSGGSIGGGSNYGGQLNRAPTQNITRLGMQPQSPLNGIFGGSSNMGQGISDVGKTADNMNSPQFQGQSPVNSGIWQALMQAFNNSGNGARRF